MRAFLHAGRDRSIDTVVVSTGAQGSYVMDDLSVGSAAAQVPEPGSLALALALVLGGLELAGAARRRRPGVAAKPWQDRRRGRAGDGLRDPKNKKASIGWPISFG